MGRESWRTRSRHVHAGITKAWQGLVGQIYADGRLGNIQQTGAEPAHYLPSSSFNYGVGAFLLAGSEIVALDESHRHPRSHR